MAIIRHKTPARVLSLILLAFLGYTSLIAQKPNLHFSGINVNGQLNDVKIWSFMEDEYGFMYFGGQNGLYKYDGYKLIKFHHSADNIYSISNDRVFSLLMDKHDRFWVGTARGLNIFDHKKNVFNNFLSPHKYPCLKNINGHIDGLSQDPQGGVWFTDKEKGLGHIKSLLEPAEFFSYDHPQYNLEFTSTAFTKEGELWLGTNHGLFLFDKSSRQLVPVRIDDYEQFNIMKLYAADDYLWIGTFNGLWRYDYKTKEFKYYRPDFNINNTISEKMVSGILPYKGGLLLGVDGGGVDFFDYKNEKFYHFNSTNDALLNCENITSLYIDKFGSIWAGTYMHGVNVSNISTNFSPIVKNKVFGSTFNCIINGFEKDHRGDLWVVTDRGGVFLKKKDSDEFTRFNLPNQKVDLMKIAATDLEIIGNDVWIATWGTGLIKIDENYRLENFTFSNDDPNNILNSDKIRCLYLDKTRDELWIGYFGAGVGLVDLHDNKFVSFRHNSKDLKSISSDWVNSIYGDDKGNIWICTTDGLCSYNRHGRHFDNMRFVKNGSKDPRYNYLNDIVQYNDSLLLIASNAAGIIKVNLEKNYKYSFIDNFFSNGEQNVNSLLVDNENSLWFCTPHTVNKFIDFQKQKMMNYRTNDGLDGLTFNNSVKFKEDNGRLYFGTNNGFLMINPKMYVPNKTPPPVYITDVLLLKKDIPTLGKEPLEQQMLLPSIKSINLEYNENDFTINFAALNFISPGNNKFKFKLEGAEENWHIEDHPKPASYYNLAPGKYKFTVLACNNDGIWNNDGAVLLINISPPWWKTWWFISFITLCVGLLIYSMITIRIKAINKQRLLLEKVVQRRTAELQTANSTLETLLYRTSHDIRGPVKSLIGLVNIGKDEFSSNEKYKIYLNHIMHSAQKLDNIVNELTLISNNSFANEVEFIDFEAIFEETKSSFQSMAGFLFFETSIQVDLFNKFLSNKKVIYSIFHNLIQNAFKYRDQTKKISYLNIHVSQSEKEVLIVFNDNGVGIEKNDLGKIFEMFFRGNVSSDGSGLGLFVVKSLVSKLGGSITVVSSLGVGTEFRLRLPLKH